MLSRPPGAETDNTESIDKNIKVNSSKLAAEESDICQQDHSELDIEKSEPDNFVLLNIAYE